MLVILVVSVFIIFKSDIVSPDDDALYIAVVGPMSGKAKPSGQFVSQGINLYIDQVNQAGGINGKEVKLLVFDDQSNKDVTQEKALEIVEQNKALVVLGHYFSSTSLIGGEIYREAGIPAISGSATAENVTEGNDWYFRVIFTNQSQAAFSANYVDRVLNQKTASIIYDQDSYGVTLAEAFENTFRGLGGEIKYVWSLDSEAEDLDERLDQIVSDLLKAKTDDPGMIFMAIHAPEAVELITSMRRRGLQYPIIGGDAISGSNFSIRFNEYPEEQAIPGYFSDGIYATSPIIFDVASGKAQQFRNEFVERYGREPSWDAATYYDAASVAVEAIRMVEAQGNPENLAKERQEIRDYLAASNSIKKAIVEGLTGHIYFDEQGNVVKPVTIGVFAQQHFISALTQLQLVPDLNRIADLDEELEAGRVLIVDEKYMHKTSVVYTGIDINEVSNIDTKNSSYTVDFYLWFRYQGQFEDNNIEFINSVDRLELGEPIAEKTMDGITYRAYRVKADFKSEFLFHDYPFDQQQLMVKFRHTNLTRDNLIYVVDLVGMRQTDSEALLEKFARTNALYSADWEANMVKFFQDIMRNDSTLGNPQFFNSDTDIEYSTFNTFIQIKRDVVSFSIKNLLILFIILGLVWIVFFLPTGELAAIRGILTSALLTVAFFHSQLSSNLPGIGYIVALDYIFYSLYTLIVLGILLTIIGFKKKEKEDEAGVRRVLMIGRVAYPAILLIGGILFAYRYGLI